jgi:O-antigen/teichoic acid export membrane protein
MKSPGLITNFVFNTVGSALPIVVALVTVPIYIHTIGPARYGVLSIVFILLGYFGFLDFGLSRASANALARLGPDGSRPDRHRVILTSFYLNLGLGTLGSIVLTLIGRWLADRFLHLPSDIGPEFDAAFPYVVCMLPLALVSGVGVGAIESRERFLASNVLQTTGNVLGQLLPVGCAVVFGPSLAIVIPAALAARLLTVIAIATYVVSTEQIRRVRVFDRSRSRALFSYGAWVSVTNLISPLLESLDQLMIGSVLGVEAVAYYAVPMSLATRSQIVAAALARTLFPRLSRLDSASAATLAQHSVVALAYGFGAICAPAILLAAPFLQLWMGAAFAERSSAVAELLMVGAWCNGIAFIPFILLQSSGRPDLGAKAHAAEIIPFVGILWGLTHSLGLAGAALAWSIRTTSDALIIFLLAGCRASYLLRLVPALLLVLVAYGLARLSQPPPLWALLRAAGVAAAVLGCGFTIEPMLRGFVVERVLRLLRRSPL